MTENEISKKEDFTSGYQRIMEACLGLWYWFGEWRKQRRQWIPEIRNWKKLEIVLTIRDGRFNWGTSQWERVKGNFK